MCKTKNEKTCREDSSNIFNHSLNIRFASTDKLLTFSTSTSISLYKEIENHVRAHSKNRTELRSVRLNYLKAFLKMRWKLYFSTSVPSWKIADTKEPTWGSNTNTKIKTEISKQCKRRTTSDLPKSGPNAHRHHNSLIILLKKVIPFQVLIELLPPKYQYES